MEKRFISVADASRSFVDCVNEVHSQNITFVLIKDGRQVARLAPDPGQICTGRDLAAAIAKTAPLSEAEVLVFHRDLLEARKTLKAPTDKWRSY